MDALIGMVYTIESNVDKTVLVATMESRCHYFSEASTNLGSSDRCEAMVHTKKNTIRLAESTEEECHVLGSAVVLSEN